jgi:hypothetical protein
MFGWHIHKWQLTSSRIGKVTQAMGISCQYPVTELLYRCIVCGVHKTEELRGNWEQEELDRK